MKRLQILTLPVLAAGILLAGCGDRSNGQTHIIKLGSASPLTGPQAHLGQDNANGAQLAVDEINAAGGVKLAGKTWQLRLLAEDDQADPKTATTVAQQLADDNVAGVIGHLNSGASIPAAKVYDDAGIPQISPSSTAIAYTHLGFRTAYRVMTNDSQQGSALAQFATHNLHATRIAVVDDRTAYGQGLADEFARAAKANGAQIVDREYTTDHSTDFLAILTSIKAQNPDVVFFGGMDPQAGPFARQMRQIGLNAQLLGGDGMETDQFIKLDGEAAAGAVASNPGLPLDQMPGGEQFRQHFTTRFGPIQNYAPYAYDAVYVMVDAMKRANSPDPEKYLPMLASTDYRGVTGEIRFDSHGDLRSGAVTLYQVTHGHWQPITTVSGATPAHH